jgi:hypothetical protein
MNDIFIKAQAMGASSKASSEFRAVQERTIQQQRAPSMRA